jgi:flagellar basal body rod protein FlgC
VSAEEEVVQQKMATYNFQGNLKVLKVADEMLGSLLDIAA